MHSVIMSLTLTFFPLEGKGGGGCAKNYGKSLKVSKEYHEMITKMPIIKANAARNVRKFDSFARQLSLYTLVYHTGHPGMQVGKWGNCHCSPVDARHLPTHKKNPKKLVR